MKRRFIKNALTRLRDRQKLLSNLTTLGVDISEFDLPMVSFMEEAISLLCAGDDEKKFELVLTDIQWWLYESVDKKITYLSESVDVNHIEDYVTWLFKHYEITD